MLWFLLLNEELRSWQQRIGAWTSRCQMCQRDAWQLTFRIWRTKGSGLNPATPFGFPVYGEAYQIRCAACGAGTMVGHPQQWTPPLGPAFVWENHQPVQAAARYMQQVFPFVR
jgi:hypothetical protein